MMPSDKSNAINTVVALFIIWLHISSNHISKASGVASITSHSNQWHKQEWRCRKVCCYAGVLGDIIMRGWGWVISQHKRSYYLSDHTNAQLICLLGNYSNTEIINSLIEQYLLIYYISHCEYIVQYKTYILISIMLCNHLNLLQVWFITIMETWN